MLVHTLDTNDQIESVTGGQYVVSTFLNGGTASLETQLNGSNRWSNVGTLSDGQPQVLTLGTSSKVKLTKTGSAVVELSK